MAVAGADTRRENQELLDAVAQSGALAKSPALRRLLVYLWEHRHEPVSEYAIGVDVFGKREDFDPRTDATVRVQISRLRQKLKEYAESEGSQGELRLSIPQGTHRLEVAPAPVVEKDPLWPRVRRWLIPSAVACVLILIAALMWQNLTLRSEVEAARRTTQLPPLWRAMLRPGRLTRVVYPIPVFYAWGQLRARDVLNNDPEGWKESANLAALVERLGKPQLSQSYSVASDTAAAIQLTRFLSGRGVPLEVSPTATLSLEQYGNENLVFLGIPPTNAAMDQYVNKTNFYLLPGHGAIGNHKPQAGEPAKFTGSTDKDNPAVQRRYGIIAVLPGHAPKSSLVLLMGLQTAALATFLTSPLSLEEFGAVWENAGRPEFFEAVVEATLNAGTVKKARQVAFRSVAANR